MPTRAVLYVYNQHFLTKNQPVTSYLVAKQGFHTWLGQVEKNGKLLILFKSFPKKYLEKIEYYFIQKLNPIFNIIHNNGGKKYVR